MTLLVKLLVISVTYNTPQNRVSDTITHVTLNTIDDSVPLSHANTISQNKIKTKDPSHEQSKVFNSHCSSAKENYNL